MKIAIFGQTLYAGLMAGLWAESGHHVYWWNEFNPEHHICYSFDDSLNQLIERQFQSSTLEWCQLNSLPLDIDVYFFALPISAQEKAINIVQFLAERAEIRPKLMINGCTFGLHVTQQLNKYTPKDYWVYLPDIVQEGQAIASFLKQQQIIVGVEDQHAQCLIEELLRPFFPLKQQFLTMPILDAEFTKLSISGMLATRISYMNDLSQVAEKLGIDLLNVRQGLASDSRIGSVYLSAGVGFGGENFCHDILTLATTVSNTGVKSRLLDQVWQINEQQKEVLFRKLWIYYHGDLKGKVIAIWGASFKENTSRIEYSPTLTLINALLAQGAIVQLHDPQALDEVRQYYQDDQHQLPTQLILCTDAYAATKHAHALCLMTAWKCYFSPDFKQLKQTMYHPFILDGRNIYDPEYVRNQGLVYTGIGRE